ncbi:hypothetical protein KP509_09G077000 [Ceratopteris richardii]|uniref:Uncharacterized protein n=1 Tax=Ceratopteris richardii TaxID=49495 RepID=A0A8T2U2L3_CERRI|nr:hypothetical protein KP509_09G077000 [Ceratopteris richardii]
MGATYSKEESYTLHNDDNGSWSRHSLSHRHQRERLYDPDKKALRDMSRPLGTVNLYDDNYIAKYRGNWHKSMSATERSKINLKTKFFGAVGKAGTAGYNKAVGVLDAMGSSMIGLHKGSAFTSASKMKADKIGILAFEVANTVSKANKLKESLSKNNIKYLEEEILCSYGVQRLVSTDKRELLNIAAADKKKELMVFVKEVTRFGSQSRDPQWHCLGRHFYKLKTDRDVAIPDVSYFEEKVRSLFLWAQQTGVLYQELSGLDRCQAEIQQMLRDEDHSDDHQKAKDLSTFHDELKTRKKTVKLLKKKSLWSKTLDEVMENLVNAVYYLHSEIEHSFRGTMTLEEFSEAEKDCERLGALGLALHYAYIIVQIDGLVSRAASVPLQARDNLYQSLPPTVKKSLRRRIFLYKMSHDKNMLLNTLYFQQELEKILSWLTPMANNTIKYDYIDRLQFA